MNKFVAIGLAFSLSALCKTSGASTFEGTPQLVQINPGTSVARVSIFAGPHGSPCSLGDWFAFENADSGVGKLWAAAVLSAYAAEKKIVVVGTGSCDSYGVEIVSFVQLK